MSSDNKYIQEHSARPEDFFVTRRQFLQRAGMGLGLLGLATLLGEEALLPVASGEGDRHPVPKGSPAAGKSEARRSRFCPGRSFPSRYRGSQTVPDAI